MEKSNMEMVFNEEFSKHIEAEKIENTVEV